MRTLNQALRIAVDQGEDTEVALNQFLDAYRQTPHSTTRCAPSNLLFKRAPRDNSPTGLAWKPPERDRVAIQARRTMTNQKASAARRAKELQLKVGDRVVVKDRHPG